MRHCRCICIFFKRLWSLFCAYRFLKQVFYYFLSYPTDIQSCTFLLVNISRYPPVHSFHHWYLSHLRCVPTPSFEEYLTSLDIRGIHLFIYILWFPSITKFLSKTLFERISPLISVSLKMCSYSFPWRISFPHSISEVSICFFISYDFPLSLNFYRKLFLNE